MKRKISLLILLVTLSFANSYDKALESFNKKDYKKSLNFFKEANNEGSIDSLYSLGYMYYYGYGTKKNYNKALKWFLKASENGSTKSFEYLGYMYGNGQGIDVNDKKAVYYYELGVKDNGSGSMCDLSEYYIKGWGVQKNYFKAMKLVKKGHELGNSNCKKIWEKYDLSSKKEKNELDYNTEKKLCKQNFNIDLHKAIEHCEYTIQLKPNDNNSRFFLGIAYFKLGMLNDALKEYNYLENQLLNNITKLGVFTQKGNVLMQQQKNDEALKYFNNALHLVQNITNEKTATLYKANIYNGIGLIAKQKGNYKKALKYLNKALLLSSQKQMKMMIANNIGVIYINQELNKDGIDSLLLALQLSDEINDNIQKDLFKSNLAMAYLFDNNTKLAEKTAKESINGAEKTNNQFALFNSYLVYSAVMEEVGNKKESDNYYDKANEIGTQIGISFEDEETKTNLSALSILKNMLKKK